MSVLGPGSTVGILGGGQLGRMLALAAARLGVRSHIYCPDAQSPAFQVCHGRTVAAYDDEDALAGFARAVDVVTYEFENVPAATAAWLSAFVPLRPGALALGKAQDRLFEKDFLSAQGIPTAPYEAVSSLDELEAAAQRIGFPCVAKTRRFGYDGKGQARIADLASCAQAWAELGEAPSIVEGHVAFDREASVVIARSLDGEVAPYPVTENAHTNRVLHESRVPAQVSEAAAQRAIGYASKAARALGYIGILAIEFFVIDGQDDVIANEMAPRVHNSGHWTQDGAATCQFEQHIRAICGMPLGDPALLAPTLMRNLLGPDFDSWPQLLADPHARLHLYGKGQVRPGRKMGHVNWVGAGRPQSL